MERLHGYALPFEVYGPTVVDAEGKTVVMLALRLDTEIGVALEQSKSLATLFAAAPDLAEALKPFAHFAAMWEAKPLNGVGDVVYAIHTGTDWAAEITRSDMDKARAALQKAGIA